jgi:hypothetical protein
MNYINKLQAIKQTHDEFVSELKTYLNSSKFSCGDELDGYVQINDILSRIRNLEYSLTEIQDQ